METKTTQKRNLTERQAHEEYGIGLRQLRLMRLRGTGPTFIKISGQLGRRGGRIVYPAVAIESWLKTCPSGGAKPDIGGNL